MQIHSGSKPFKCPYCSKNFSLDFNLRTHIRIHTGERPFQCPYPECTKACAQQGNLTIHMKQVHGQVRAILVKTAGTVEPEDEDHFLITGSLSKVKSSKPGVSS